MIVCLSYTWKRCSTTLKALQDHQINSECTWTTQNATSKKWVFVLLCIYVGIHTNARGINKDKCYFRLFFTCFFEGIWGCQGGMRIFWFLGLLISLSFFSFLSLIFSHPKNSNQTPPTMKKFCLKFRLISLEHKEKKEWKKLFLSLSNAKESLAVHIKMHPVLILFRRKAIIRMKYLVKKIQAIITNIMCILLYYCFLGNKCNWLCKVVWLRGWTTHQNKSCFQVQVHEYVGGE